MKKKASLLISGITTVAMLAVAVGSFAAWDNLTADKAPSFTATSGSPAALKVVTADSAPTGKLVPSDGIKLADEVDSVNIGTVKATLETADAEAVDKSSAATISCKLTEVKSGGTDAATNFKVTLVPEAGKGASDVILDAATAKEIKAGVTYTAKLEYNTGINESDAATLGGKAISVKAEVTAVKK